MVDVVTEAELRMLSCTNTKQCFSGKEGVYTLLHIKNLGFIIVHCFPVPGTPPAGTSERLFACDERYRDGGALSIGSTTHIAS